MANQKPAVGHQSNPTAPNMPMPGSTLNTLLDQRARFLSFVQRRVNDPTFAEDILQAAYIRALEHSGTLRQEQSVVAWFYSVLRNAVIDHYRRRSSENSALDRWASELELNGPRSSEEPVSINPAAEEFICGCIGQVLSHLRTAYAEVLREVDLSGGSLADFACHHQLRPGNAAVRAHRARAAFKRELVLTCGSCSDHSCLNCTCKLPVRTTSIS